MRGAKECLSLILDKSLAEAVSIDLAKAATSDSAAKNEAADPSEASVRQHHKRARVARNPSDFQHALPQAST